MGSSVGNALWLVVVREHLNTIGFIYRRNSYCGWPKSTQGKNAERLLDGQAMYVGKEHAFDRQVAKSSFSIRPLTSFSVAAGAWRESGPGLAKTVNRRHLQHQRDYSTDIPSKQSSGTSTLGTVCDRS